MPRRIVAFVAVIIALFAIVPVASATAAPSTAAVYRFWSAEFSGHFYTTSVTERDQIIANYPDSTWRYEGAAYGAFDTQVTGSTPLYRFWSSAYRGHFFTTDVTERDYVIANYEDYEWSYEGIAFYVYPLSTDFPDTKPVARFWSDTFRHHFYTADAAEADFVKNNYPSNVWRFEGDAFEVPTTAPDAVQPPDSYLTDGSWSGTDSDGYFFRFVFQSDGTLALTIDDESWDDPADTWVVTGSTLNIHLEFGDGDIEFTGPIAVGSINLNGTQPGWPPFTLTIVKE